MLYGSGSNFLLPPDFSLLTCNPIEALTSGQRLALPQSNLRASWFPVPRSKEK